MDRWALVGSMAALAAAACVGFTGVAGAATWTPLPSGTSDTITAIEYQSATRFWFATEQGRIFRRVGDGFEPVLSPTGIAFTDIDFQPTGQIGLAVGKSGQILRTTNGGANWVGVTGVLASSPTTTNSCGGTFPIGDVDSVDFVGEGRVVITGVGSQIAASAPPSASNVGAPGMWMDANRTPSNTCRIDEDVDDSFFASATQGFFAGRTFGTVFFTSDFLATPAIRRPATTGGGLGAPRRLAGDPANPLRQWSISPAGDPSLHRLTVDGWQSAGPWTIANPGVRALTPTFDVDHAGGTVLAAGNGGTILTSADGQSFFLGGAGGAADNVDWRAVSLASATAGAVGGTGGNLVVTNDANAVAPPPGPPPPGGDTIAPELSRLTLTNRRFRVSRRATPISAAQRVRRRRAPTGTTIRYTLSEAATVTFRIERKLSGRLVRRRGSRRRVCVHRTRRNARNRRCTRFARAGTLTRRGAQGAKRVAFSGRIGRRKLAPGAYRIVLRPTDAAGNRGRSRTLSFTIVR